VQLKARRRCSGLLEGGGNNVQPEKRIVLHVTTLDKHLRFSSNQLKNGSIYIVKCDV
jgi:hypothetical protein